jgi:hypothetical protein
LYALGLYWIALGAFQAIAPGAFFDLIGPFGAENDHYIRDASTWSLALGTALLLAARRPSWRAPVLVLALVQAVLHTVVHLVDIGDADPSWVGPFDAIALAVLALATFWLLRHAGEEGSR